MKNIHILSTDNPSRLVKIYNDFNKETFTLKLDVEVNDLFKEYVNIYITSDEDIADNDWIVTKDGRVVQVTYLLSKDLESAFKIILTTDQDLIKDDVQEIDDEFLEWFINNANCEEVEIYQDKKDYGTFQWYSEYKIIIPKEEPKTMFESLQEYLKNTPKEKVLEDWNGFQYLDDEGITVKEFLENQKQTDEKGRPLTYWGGLEEHKQETFLNEKCFKCGRNQYSSRKPFCTDDFCNKDFYQKPKQETFEDAAKDFVENTMKFSFTSIDTRTQANRMFKCVEFGAKWQQERSYSENDMLNFAWFLLKNVGQYSDDRLAHFEGEYLKQFKKK